VAGTSEHLYLAEHRAGKLNDSGTIPATAGGEGITEPIPDGIIHTYSFYPKKFPLLCE
jgi:hypothetical protein